MRFSRRHTLELLCYLPVVALTLQRSLATPVQTESDLQYNSAISKLSNETLEILGRGYCAGGSLCGYYDQLCCKWDERCYTGVNNQASCTPAPTATRSGHWVYYTRTYVVTNRITKTKTYSSFVGYSSPPPAAPTTTQKEAHCSGRQVPCGPICCKGWQYCVVQGQCGTHPGSYSAPARPTSVQSLMPTTVRKTTTVGFQPAVQTGHHRHPHMGGGGGISVSETSSGGLSGGAIAGIVIGVLLGIFFLILLCLFLCFASAWNALLAFFGLGRKRRRETVEVEEYHHHGSRSDNRRWYGAGGKQNRPPPPKKKKDGFGWGTVVLGLAGLWAALGLKRRHDKKRVEKDESNISSDYYSDYYSNNSSSDRRTRDTRRSSRR